MEEDNVQYFFNSIKSYSDIERLINEGQSEGSYLECKATLSVTSFNRELQSHIAKVISSFSNTEGGVFIFGVGTSKKGNENLDILIRIEPIGSINLFMASLKRVMPLLTDPGIKATLRIIKRRKSDSDGILLMYVPRSEGDPVREKDRQFHIRIGDENPRMPYEQIKRMFIGGSSPDLEIDFIPSLIKRQVDGRWKIPIVVQNNNNYPGKTVNLSVLVLNKDSFVNIDSANGLRDESDVNPNTKTFMGDLERPVYKRLNVYSGELILRPKGRNRSVLLNLKLYAENMVAREQVVRISLTTNASVKQLSTKLLY
jgi:hypothetical protein